MEIAMISSQKIGMAISLFQICPKEKMIMRRKSNTFEEECFPWGQQNTGVPYYVDNLFYESFGMSCDEFFETLMKREFPKLG